MFSAVILVLRLVLFLSDMTNFETLVESRKLVARLITKDTPDEIRGSLSNALDALDYSIVCCVCESYSDKKPESW